MAGKCFPSQSNSVQLRKESVNRLHCWTLRGSSSLDSFCSECYTFFFSILAYWHRNGKASVKYLCLTFLRWVSSLDTRLPAAGMYVSGDLLILFFTLLLWIPLNCVADLQISLNDIHVLSWTFLSGLCDLKKCLMKLSSMPVLCIINTHVSPRGTISQLTYKTHLWEVPASLLTI